MALSGSRKFCSIVKNKIRWLKRQNFTKSFQNAKTNKQKWNLLKTIGANREKNYIDESHKFNVNELKFMREFIRLLLIFLVFAMKIRP